MSETKKAVREYEGMLIEKTTLKQYTGKASQVVIPPEVDTIAVQAFTGCKELKEIIIPETVERIEAHAIMLCNHLTHLVVKGHPETVPIYGYSDLVYSTDSLHSAGPLGSGADYEYGWKEFIPDGAFTNLDLIILPAELKKLGSKAIQCRNLPKIVCPGSTFSLLPAKFKLLPAIEWLKGKMKPDAARDKAVIAYVKRAKETLFEKLYAKKNAAAIDRLLQASEPDLKTLDSFIAKTEKSGLPEVMAVLLNYKADHFSPKTAEKAVQVKQQKELGEKELTLKDWRDIYRLSDNGDSFSIMKYKKSEEIVAIPEKIAGKPVVAIGPRAFADNKTVVEITIPDSVKEIGEEAFKNCEKLQTVEMPKSLKELGFAAFRLCSSLQRITVPGGIKVLSGNLFDCCKALAEVSIPEGVKSIEQNAFASCSNLKEISLPDSVQAIKNSVFLFCENLESVRIPSGLTEVGNYAFQWCKQLREIVLPDHLASIGCEAFAHCGSLKTVRLPGSLETIRFNAFLECESLETCELPSSLRTLEHSVFKGCKKLESLTIPEKVSKLAGGLVAGCTSLETLTVLGESVEVSDKLLGDTDDVKKHVTIIAQEGASILSFAQKRGIKWKSISQNKTSSIPAPKEADLSFWKLRNDIIEKYTGHDREVVIPASIGGKTVRRLGPALFEDNTLLEKVVISEGIELICDNAFRGCSSLSEIIFPESLNDVGNNYSMNGYPTGDTPFHGTLWEKNAGEMILAGSVLVRYLGKEENVVIPEGVQVIGELAFAENKTLKTVKFPATLKIIRRAAFEGCEQLAEVLLPEGITQIESGAFSGCSSLEELILPESVKSFGDEYGGWVLDGCSNMKKLVIKGSHPCVQPGQLFGCDFETVLLRTELDTAAEKNIQSIATAETGDTVLFGQCSEAVEWIVLKKETDRALLLAKDCLEKAKYQSRSSQEKPCTWELCQIRAWLNGPFYSMVFSDEEKRIILQTANQTPANAKSGATGGKDTVDKVFLLSEQEVKQYVPKEIKTCKYRLPYGVESCWWTRTPSTDGKQGVVVRGNGTFAQDPSVIRNFSPWNIAGIRPALWVKI